MYNKILVAVDGSATSDAALGEAMKLAAAAGELRIVHVVDEVTFNWDEHYANPSEIFQAMAKDGDRILRGAQERVAREGRRCDTHLLEMDKAGRRVPEMIADEAEAWGADLIVIGAHGRRGAHHALLGSVAEGVARLASKPVLLVRGA
jgi:nucleotide-binding universal stress UspA family protein